MRTEDMLTFVFIWPSVHMIFSSSYGFTIFAICVSSPHHGIHAQFLDGLVAGCKLKTLV